MSNSPPEEPPSGGQGSIPNADGAKEPADAPELDGPKSLAPVPAQQGMPGLPFVGSPGSTALGSNPLAATAQFALGLQVSSAEAALAQKVTPEHITHAIELRQQQLSREYDLQDATLKQDGEENKREHEQEIAERNARERSEKRVLILLCVVGISLALLERQTV